VQRLFPVIDGFRAARATVPPETEREENMHKNFGSLLSSMLLILEKSGYKEYDVG
jgi:molecular chaperone GrpE (heat shock protein)